MPDDKEGDELLKKAQKADAYQEAMAKKAEQSRLLRLQEGIPSGKKPPVPEEAVEEASEKRKAPFMYRPDYKPEKKLTEEEEVVRGMIIEGYPGITKSSRSGSLEDRLTFSADDQLKNAKEELERQYKLEDISLGAEMVKKQTAINKEDDRRREAWRRREAEYIKQDQQGKGSLLAFRRLLKARSPYYGRPERWMSTRTPHTL